MSLSAKKRMLIRAAKDIEAGMVVNLGIGLPTLITDYLPKDLPVYLHSENGIVGVGAKADEGQKDRNLIDAGGAYVTPIEGTSYFDSAVSFSIVRSGRLDMTLLGAFQVSTQGDLANWIIPKYFTPGAGGAIELAQKARKVSVITTHVDKRGEPKILEKCTLPLTARGCVNRIYTDMAVIDVTSKGLQLMEIAEGISVRDVMGATAAKLYFESHDLPKF